MPDRPSSESPESREASDRLRGELDRAYSQLAEITSHLLAVNEASELFVSSHDKETVAINLLTVAAQKAGALQGAVFLASGESHFGLLATMGFSEEGEAAMSGSLPDLAICQLVSDVAESLTLDEAVEHERFGEWRTEQLEADPEAAVEPLFALYVPLVLEGSVLGVLCLGSRASGALYGAEEKILIEHIANQGALALDRALLFEQNENRLQDLDALLRIGRELTSTLDVDRVLLTAVNTTAAIVERERAVLALFAGEKLVIRAVSDFPRVDSGTAERLGLVRLLEWLSLKKPEVVLSDADQVESEEELAGREVLAEYFSGEMRALYAVRLQDDQGPVGYLLLESYREGSFAQESDRDALRVMAGQLAVSVRNAELYRQLPMVGALAPLAARRRHWQQMAPAKRRYILLAAAVVVIGVALIQWPRSVAGDARVLPAVETAVRARTEGVLDRVGVQSGDRVRAGQVLASLDPVPASARMAELRASALVARSQSAEAEVARDPVARRLAELRQDEAMARLAEARLEGARTQLVAPVDGYVLTPAIDERIGDWLEAGDVLCQVSPLDTLRVEVAVAEEDIGRIQAGQRLRVKVLGFPERQFTGLVTDISWIGDSPGPGMGSHFAVRGWVENPGPSLRAGMTGRARIDVEGATLLWRMTRGVVRMFRFWAWI